MKFLKCDECMFEAKGETFNEWFKEMHTHYGETHPEILKRIESGPKLEHEVWIAKVKSQFDTV